MARIEIATLVQRYRQLEKELASLQEQLTEFIQATVEYEYLQTVPGLGDATIIDLLSEIGSFAHYKHPRQLIETRGIDIDGRIHPDSTKDKNEFLKEEEASCVHCSSES